MMKFMNIIVSFVLIFSLIGCASSKLHRANKEYDTHAPGRNIAIKKGSFKSDVYETDSARYYEINLTFDKVYVEVSAANKLFLIEDKPSNAVLVGVSTIHISPNSEYYTISTNIGTSKYEYSHEYAKDVYVFLLDDENSVNTIERTQSAWIVSNNKLQYVGEIYRKLTKGTSHKIISAARNAGYLITVPADLTTVPFFLLLLPFAKGLVGGPGR